MSTGLILIISIVWGVGSTLVIPLAMVALRRWAYSWNRWLSSAIAFVVTLALCSLFVVVLIWRARSIVPGDMNARAYMFGVAMGEGAALLISAIMAGAVYRLVAARRRETIPASPTEPC